jgi:hypothetical protein
MILFRLHGSAVFKSVLPAFTSSGIYLLLFYMTDLSLPEYRALVHPYPMGALISALTFLLSFRATFAYNRYWEACTSVHQMHSKWLDVATQLAASHLQSTKYAAQKPPAFGSYPELKTIQRERQRVNEQTYEDLQEQLEQSESEMKTTFKLRLSKMVGRGRQNSRRQSERALYPKLSLPNKKQQPTASTTTGTSENNNNNNNSHYFNKKDVYRDEPPFFLEESAHLISLLSAVAFSTLRNDLESADSPLITFYPGAPFPHVDPDAYNADIRAGWTRSTHKTTLVLEYLFGLSRGPARRTLYNAARPFRVVGGVSDVEIQVLQAARGPSAKVALCAMWLQEFITREYMAGSMGMVSPPIVSRLYQYISDGMLGYNQARKSK